MNSAPPPRRHWMARSGDGVIAIRSRSSLRRLSPVRTCRACARQGRVLREPVRMCRFSFPDLGRWRCLPMMIANEEERLRQALTFADRVIPERIDAGADVVENGLARLVLAIVELVRRLLEKQALRRMDRGTLTDDEVERLGSALMKLEEKMAELKRVFGLEDDDLNLSLGPIRTLD